MAAQCFNEHSVVPDWVTRSHQQLGQTPATDSIHHYLPGCCKPGMIQLYMTIADTSAIVVEQHV